MFDNFQFYLNSILLGIGLAMDACAVSMANGLNEPKMKTGKITLIAIMFALFQAIMPMIGWVCVHYIAEQFSVVNDIIPYIALALLAFIGGKMLFEGFGLGKPQKDETATKSDTTNVVAQTDETAIEADGANVEIKEVNQSDAVTEQRHKPLTLWLLTTQAIATSIDALSVGFTISNYNALEALVAVCIIAAITFGICFGAVHIGKKFGTKLGNKAEIVGGFILIAIGLEIFISSFF